MAASPSRENTSQERDTYAHGMAELQPGWVLLLASVSYYQVKTEFDRNHKFSLVC